LVTALSDLARDRLLSTRGSVEREDRGRALISRTKLAVLAALVFSMAGACGDDAATERVRRAKVSEGCAINSDCSSDLKCVWQRCHVECETSKDCDAALRCVT